MKSMPCLYTVTNSKMSLHVAASAKQNVPSTDAWSVYNCPLYEMTLAVSSSVTSDGNTENPVDVVNKCIYVYTEVIVCQYVSKQMSTYGTSRG